MHHLSGEFSNLAGLPDLLTLPILGDEFHTFSIKFRFRNYHCEGAKQPKQSQKTLIIPEIATHLADTRNDLMGKGLQLLNLDLNFIETSEKLIEILGRWGSKPFECRHL